MDEPHLENENNETIPSLNLQDLVTTLRLLSIAVRRGAYEPKELTEVGNTYSKLEEFLKYQAQLNDANKNKQGEE